MVGAGGHEEVLAAAAPPPPPPRASMPESVAAEEDVVASVLAAVAVWWLKESGLPAEMVCESETGLSERDWAAELEESAEGENLRLRAILEGVCGCPASVRITLAVLMTLA